MPGENIQDWSTTAANNGNSDSSINWAEGQPRASVNNSARSMMAAHAKDRNLQNGSIVTGGTANAQIFFSGLDYTTVPTGLRVLLKIGPALTNTGAATFEMDGLGAVAIKTNTGGDLVAGMLIANTYNEFRYDGTNWILLRDATDYVNVSGDTMTGALTVPSLTATGTIHADGSIDTDGSITADSVITTGSGIICAGLQVGMGGMVCAGGAQFSSGLQITGTVTIFSGALNCFGTITAADSLAAQGGNCTVGGNGFKPGGGPWADSSDARIKNVVGNYSSGLAEIAQIEPVRYTFKGNDADHRLVAESGKEFVGVVAQDIEQYLPELVTQVSGDIDGVAVNDLRILDTTPLVYALVNSIKELLKRIEALETKVP